MVYNFIIRPPGHAVGIIHPKGVVLTQLKGRVYLYHHMEWRNTLKGVGDLEHPCEGVI